MLLPQYKKHEGTVRKHVKPRSHTREQISSFLQVWHPYPKGCQRERSYEVVDCAAQYVPSVEATCVVARVQHVAQVDGVDGIVKQQQIHWVVQAVRP